jgi:hypothetical protein
LFEADIRGYFNHIQHEWLQKMVAHRIADRFILRASEELSMARSIGEISARATVVHCRTWLLTATIRREFPSSRK